MSIQWAKLQSLATDELWHQRTGRVTCKSTMTVAFTSQEARIHDQCDI